MSDDYVAPGQEDYQVAKQLIAQLSLKDLTDQQIEQWSLGAIDIPSVQLKFEQIGKELRDLEQVVEKIVNRIKK